MEAAGEDEVGDRETTGTEVVEAPTRAVVVPRPPAVMAAAPKPSKLISLRRGVTSCGKKGHVVC